MTLVAIVTRVNTFSLHQLTPREYCDQEEHDEDNENDFRDPRRSASDDPEAEYRRNDRHN
jgi:hypothetical protein